MRSGVALRVRIQARSPRQFSNEVHGRDCQLMEGKAEPVDEAAPQPTLFPACHRSAFAKIVLSGINLPLGNVPIAVEVGGQALPTLSR